MCYGSQHMWNNLQCTVNIFLKKYFFQLFYSLQCYIYQHKLYTFSKCRYLVLWKPLTNHVYCWLWKPLGLPILKQNNLGYKSCALNCKSNLILLKKIWTLSSAAMRQLYESDRKLRALSRVKYSKISQKTLKLPLKQVTDQAAQDIIIQGDAIAADLRLNILPGDNDATVIFFVSV